MIFKNLCLALVVVLIIGCSSSNDPRYKVSSIGNYSRAVKVEILTSEKVIITRSNSGAGSNSGGLMGASLAASNSDNPAVIIAGLISGAVIGNLIESELNQANGTQYLIKTGNEALLTVAQIDDGNHIFKVGEKAVLIYGHPHRLVKHPR